MFYSLNGKLILVGQSFAVVECAGIGFRCETTLNTLRNLPTVGEDVILYTHLAVRENAVELFGFFSLDELELFRLLITVSGVGAKAAVSILSALTPEELTLAVSTGDAAAIKAAKGIGLKTAQKIVLELGSHMPELSSAGINGLKGSSGSSGISSEAAQALISLGYRAEDVTRVISSLPDELSTEEMIKQALRMLF